MYVHLQVHVQGAGTGVHVYTCMCVHVKCIFKLFTRHVHIMHVGLFVN